ncbi:MAG: ABC transporter ATP-binding protein [Planctomycetes bacterium]|nr:ABC transporter ATP-binding protein [Planctomycetota bacterium]
MSDLAVSVRNLRKAFGSQVVLEDVSLEVPGGQTLALLGRNGAGKTTMIRTLLGLLPADSGTMRVAGCDPATESLELRRRVGYLAEDQSMYDWMTALELCRFLEPFYPQWDAKLADQYLERFELPRHVRIERLSKGQVVKLGLAVALAHAPQVAILDDPALGLDPVARKEFNRDLVEHLQAEGRTVIYSSHLLDEVEAVADTVAILDRGRIVRQGPPETLREEVQRIVLSKDVVRQRPAPQGLLDVRKHGESYEIVVDGAPRFIGELNAAGHSLQSTGMTLDDIFEAFVIGRPQAWREA